MPALQGTAHHRPPHRVPEVEGPLRREPDPASNAESERYAGFDLLLTQAVEVPPRERRAKRRSK
jgi:hypothetical protein